MHGRTQNEPQCHLPPVISDRFNLGMLMACITPAATCLARHSHFQADEEDGAAKVLKSQECVDNETGKKAEKERAATEKAVKRLESEKEQAALEEAQEENEDEVAKRKLMKSSKGNQKRCLRKKADVAHWLTCRIPEH